MELISYFVMKAYFGQVEKHSRKVTFFYAAVDCFTAISLFLQYKQYTLLLFQSANFINCLPNCISLFKIKDSKMYECWLPKLQLNNVLTGRKFTFEGNIGSMLASLN